MVDARKGQGPNVFNLEFDDDDKYLWRAGNRWSREIQDRLGFGRTSELSWTATDQDDQDDQNDQNDQDDQLCENRRPTRGNQIGKIPEGNLEAKYRLKSRTWNVFNLV